MNTAGLSPCFLALAACFGGSVVAANAGRFHVMARGFRMAANDRKVDGFAQRTTSGSYAPRLFGFEQVVALEGPAGVLCGTSGAPGGRASFITKKPQPVSRVQNDSRVRTFVGGESAFEEQTEWSREERAQRNSSISPASSRTTADGRTDYTLRDASPRDVSLPAGGRVGDTLTTGFDLTARLSDARSTNAAAQYHDRGYKLNAWSIQTATLRQIDAADARSRVVSRHHSRAGWDIEDLGFGVNTSYTLRPTRAVENVTQLGVDFRPADNPGYATSTGAMRASVNIYTGRASAALVAAGAAEASVPVGS